MSLIIGLPRESRPSERRVALDPSRVERLVQAGLRVQIQAECGHSASFHDDDYPDVAVMDSFADVVREADIVVKVVCPTHEEIQLLTPGTVLVCIMSAFQHVEEVAALNQRRITVLAMDHLPRTTRAQPLDALSSQATVAGYKAALLAAELSPRLYPMLTTAAGTIRPSRVLVIGAGVAGLQAIATSRRLGAQVQAYDIRRAAKEQIESLGARMIDTGVEVEGSGGFARPLRKDEKQKQHDVLAEHLARAHVVICAAAIPGRRAPRIISEDMVDGMLPESVIVDLAASTGGNCELTRTGEHYYHNETLIVGPLNLPSHGAVHASEMYSRNVHNMLELIIGENDLFLDPSDEIIARCVVCHDGRIHHEPTAAALETEHVVFGGATHRAVELPDQTAGWLPDADDQGSAVETANDVAETLQTKDSGDTVLPEDALEILAPQGSTEAVAWRDPFATGTESTESGLRDGSSEADSSEADASNTVQQMHVARTAGQKSIAAGSAEAAADDETLPADDLTLIDGIGPAIQERLYAFGYRRLEQLAALDTESISKLAIQLEVDDEVVEQDWAGQARALLERRK